MNRAMLLPVLQWPLLVWRFYSGMIFQMVETIRSFMAICFLNNADDSCSYEADRNIRRMTEGIFFFLNKIFHWKILLFLELSIRYQT